MMEVDRRWLKHLAPTTMHKLRGKFERLLSNWSKSDFDPRGCQALVARLNDRPLTPAQRPIAVSL